MALVPRVLPVGPGTRDPLVSRVPLDRGVFRASLVQLEFRVIADIPDPAEQPDRWDSPDSPDLLDFLEQPDSQAPKDQSVHADSVAQKVPQV